MPSSGAFSFQLSGYAPARRDATLEIVNETTGEKRTVAPFLDGSAVVRGLPTGAYQVRVLHPNVVGQLVDMRRIRLFEGLPTRVTLPLPEELFRDVPVRDTPDADLTPVHDAAVAARDLVVRAGSKQPGDPIRSDDWNAVVGALGDLATAVAELTRLVSPTGHDHPELEEKLDEGTGNLRRFADQFGAQLARIQRTLQTLAIERQVEESFADAGIVPDAVRHSTAESIALLKSYSDSDTLVWGSRKKTAYSSILKAMEELRDAQPDPGPLEESAPFKSTVLVATEEATVPAARTVGGELDHYGRVNAKTSGALLYTALRK